MSHREALLEAALRFYANQENWRWDAAEGCYVFAPGFVELTSRHPWDRAQQALSAIAATPRRTP